MLASALPLFLQLLPVIGAMLVGLVLAPTFKRSRVTGACLAGLAVVLVSDLRFAAVGASPWRWVLLLPLAAVWLAPWFLVPLKMYRFPLPRGTKPVERFDPARHPLPDASTAWIVETAAALATEGFASVDDVGARLPTGRAVRWVVMDHRSEAIRAVLTAGPETLAGPDDHLMFVTMLADGRYVVGGNTREPRDHPVVRYVVGARFLDLRGAGELLAAYRAFVRDVAGDQPRTLPPGDDAQGFFSENARRMQDEMVALGWYRHYGEGYRLTLRGTFLGTWSAAFPLRQVLVGAARKNQDRVLRRLGIPLPPRESESWPARWMSFGGLQVAGAVAVLALGLAWPWLAARGGPGALVPALAAARADTVVPERLPRGFAVPADFPGAVAALERLTGAKARALTVDDGFTGAPSDAMMVPVAKRRVDALLAGAQPAFLASGFVLFHTQEFSGVHGEPEALALFPSRDPVDVVLKLNTNGANYGIEPTQVADWLREVEREHPFTVTSAGFDFVEARFHRPLADGEALALATRVEAFCPDVVSQGTGTVRALAKEMQRRRTLYCWWD